MARSELNRYQPGQLSRAARKAYRAVLLELDPTCIWCGHRWTDDIPVWSSQDYMPTIEHLIPLSEGGDYSLHNLALACRGCNK